MLNPFLLKIQDIVIDKILVKDYHNKNFIKIKQLIIKLGKSISNMNDINLFYFVFIIFNIS